MVMKKKVSFIDTKALTDDEYKCEGQCQGHKCTFSKKAKKTVIKSYFDTKFCNVSRIYL